MLTNKDYCDYETCVALKELGYKVPTSAYYMPHHKDPKTDRETGHGFKKSHKGCCIVTKNSDGNLICEDDYYLWENTHKYPNLLLPIFKDGKFIKETSLSEIRNRLHNKF